MPIIEASALIDRPIAEVWDLWTNVRRLPELSQSTVRVDAPARLDAAGQTFRQVSSGFGRELEVEWTVEEVVPEDRLVITGTPVRGVHVRLSEEVAPIERSGRDATAATLQIEYQLPFGPAGRLVSRMGIEKRARKEAAEVVAGLERLALAPDPR